MEDVLSPRGGRREPLPSREKWRFDGATLTSAWQCLLEQGWCFPDSSECREQPAGSRPWLSHGPVQTEAHVHVCSAASQLRRASAESSLQPLWERQFWMARACSEWRESADSGAACQPALYRHISILLHTIPVSLASKVETEN